MLKHYKARMPTCVVEGVCWQRQGRPHALELDLQLWRLKAAGSQLTLQLHCGAAATAVHRQPWLLLLLNKQGLLPLLQPLLWSLLPV
jgi:hypothetical protein